VQADGVLREILSPFVFTIVSPPTEPIPAAAIPEAAGGLATEALDDWFVQKVLPLEPALMRLLRRHWRRSDEWPDLRQDIYVRLYETVARDGLPQQTPAYVFTCARHLLIDRARRAQVVPIDAVAELEALADLPGDELTPERLAGARGELRLLQAALDDLPPRCREVVALRKIDGLSQKEIAARLGIAEGTVEKQVTLGVRALAQALTNQGVELAAAWARRWRRTEHDL
jgi:RNA polymerase sigma factor (sigma-70 family)